MRLALVAAPAQAQGSYSPYDESPSAALARYVRTLASDPTDFQSLIGAGRAALELGDAQAAAGFFARADDANPNSPLPQAGMGAVSVANGNPQAALPYFQRAQQLGAPLAIFACDRGLAYDLLGQQAKAQADYRVALGGSDARRGAPPPRTEPGDQRRSQFGAADAGAARRARRCWTSARPRLHFRADRRQQRGDERDQCGDAGQLGAGRALRAAAAFAFRRPAGRRGEPRNLPRQWRGVLRVAAAPGSAGRPACRSRGVAARRPAAAAAQPSVQTASRPVQVAYARPLPDRAAVPAQDLAAARQRLRRCGAVEPIRAAEIEEPRPVRRAQALCRADPGGARLLVGPFRGRSDAATLAEDFATVGIEASNFTNSQADRIAPLAGE